MVALGLFFKILSIVPFLIVLRFFSWYYDSPQQQQQKRQQPQTTWFDWFFSSSTRRAAPTRTHAPRPRWGEFKKVLVPAIFNEWRYKDGELSLNGERYPPFWFWNKTFQSEYGYTTVVYQKQNSSAPNFIATNRGCENGAYFNFIVDNYHDFPDVAIFIHAKPEEHIPTMDWLNQVKCLRTNMTYSSLNRRNWFCRNSWNGLWARKGIWIEQCLRDTLQTAWDLLDNQTEFNLRVPPNKPIEMCTHCCQQFAVGRGQILKRPLRVWKKLRDILSVQDQCHVGEPQYEYLYSFIKSQRWKLGPEPVNLSTGKGEGFAYGRFTQAVAAEHLAHVIFGEKSLVATEPGMDETCDQFLPSTSCPGSPCDR